MKTQRMIAVQCAVVSVMLLLLCSFMLAQEQRRRKEKYVCSEPKPEAICSAENTCGSSSVPCTVDIKRTGSGASATPGIPHAKGNMPYCGKAGTTVTWENSSKNTGFVLDFGPDSPFDQEAIIGGSDCPVSAVANKKGCYKFSTGHVFRGPFTGCVALSKADSSSPAANNERA